MIPFLIFIDGPMGSGKTTSTKLLNQKLPDSARIALPDIKRLVPNYQESEGTLSVAREVMKAMTTVYLSADVSVIIECISKAEGIASFQAIAEKHNASFFVYRLTASKETRWKRVQARTCEMMGVSELPPEKIKELEGYFEPNHAFYINNPVLISKTIDTELMKPEQVADHIISELKSIK